MTQKRIIAEFVPQAWIRDFDFCMRVEPLGPTAFDVTETILAMGRKKALSLRDDQYETDALRHVAGAPQWIKDWEGPFYVAVESAIADFFEEE